MTDLIHGASLSPRPLLPPHQGPDRAADRHAQRRQAADHPAGNRTGIALLLRPHNYVIVVVVSSAHRLRRRICHRRRPATASGGAIDPANAPRHPHRRTRADEVDARAVEGVARFDERVRRDGRGDGVDVLQRDQGGGADRDAVVLRVGCRIAGVGAELEDGAADGGGGSCAVCSAPPLAGGGLGGEVTGFHRE